jgi:hypothetical protein
LPEVVLVATVIIRDDGEHWETLVKVEPVGRRQVVSVDALRAAAVGLADEVERIVSVA